MIKSILIATILIVSTFFMISSSINVDAATPTISSPSPANNSYDNAKKSLTFSCVIANSASPIKTGGTTNWTITCVQNGTGYTESGTYGANITATYNLTGLNYYTTYTIWVNVSDNVTTTKTPTAYYINTMNSTAPVITLVYPTNASTDAASEGTLTFTVTDANGDTFNWTVWSGTPLGNTSANNAANGTKTMSYTASGGTTFDLWINASDFGTTKTTPTYVTFTTGSSGGATGGGSGGGGGGGGGGSSSGDDNEPIVITIGDGETEPTNTPGFELLSLLVAMGVAYIILKRR